MLYSISSNQNICKYDLNLLEKVNQMSLNNSKIFTTNSKILNIDDEKILISLNQKILLLNMPNLVYINKIIFKFN